LNAHVKRVWYILVCVYTKQYFEIIITNLCRKKNTFLLLVYTEMAALRVENSRKLGVNCGVKCTILIIVICMLYLLLSLAVSLVNRLYLKAYYMTAHVSALASFTAAFTLTNHLGRVRVCLGYCEKTFYTQQCILNLLHFVCHLAMAFAFSILIALSINLNLDYVVTTVWAWGNTVLSVYLFVLTAAAARSQRYSKYELSMAAKYKGQ
jgi:hypothetical protein